MDDIAPDPRSALSEQDEAGRVTDPSGVDSSTDEGHASADEKTRVAAEEKAWIRRAQAGDEEAFAWLVRTHEMRAFRIARGLLPNEEDARDVAQEAFLRVFRSLERFDFGFAFSTDHSV